MAKPPNPQGSPNDTAGLGRGRELTVVAEVPSLPKRKFRITSACNRNCSLNVTKHPARVAALLHSWYEEGWNNFNIRAKAQVLGSTLSESAIARHRANHLEVVDPNEIEDEEPAAADGQKLSDVQILDRIIRQGSSNLSSKAVKVSPEMLMRAMELKYKLTQGSVMEDTFSAIAKAMGGGTENPSAAQSAEETEQQLSDMAPEVSDDGIG